MGKLAVLGALVALSTLASVGPIFADDDGGGATDNSAAATPDAGADPALPAADPLLPAADPALPAADPALPAADPVEPPDPFSTIQWEGSSYDNAPQPGSTGPEPSKVGPIR